VRRTKHPRAYTLIELLIVVTILGIAGAMVIPEIASTGVLRVQAAVRTIVSDINYIQSDAMARQQARAIIFDTAANTYTLLEVPGAMLNPETDTIRKVDLNYALKFHDSKLTGANIDGDNVLIFDEFGGPITEPGTTTPSAGGTITVSGSGQVYTIAVEAYTGRVTVSKVPGP
jgi:prepilin-type N-terminal cleavage/methylation domain-containing protein